MQSVSHWIYILMCLWVVFSSETSVDRYTYTTLKAVQKAEFIHCATYNDMLDLESHDIMVKYVFNTAMYTIL